MNGQSQKAHAASGAPPTPGEGQSRREVLRFAGLDMRFGATHALRNVGLDVRAGEIHGLLGQNGSGKSTVIKVLAGLHTPSAGRLWLAGDEVRLPLSPAVRASLRLAFVHQDLGLLPELNVVENLWSTTSAVGPALARIDWRTARSRAERALSEYGVQLDPRTLVRDLSPIERASLAIVRAMDAMNSGSSASGGTTPGLLVLDEPTVFLSGPDAARLYGLMRRVVAEGSGVLFVSHDIDEVKHVTDRLTVLRDGVNVGTELTAELTVEQIVAMVIGSAPSPPARKTGVVGDRRQEGNGETGTAATGKASKLLVQGLTTPRLRGVSFVAVPGQIVGLTGLPGSGFEGVLYALYGATPPQAGRMSLGAVSEDLAHMSTTKARSLGLAFVPNDRLSEGCVPHMTVTENNSLLTLDACRRGPFFSRRRARTMALRQIKGYGIRVAGPESAYATMSGGNQQKAVLAKWLDVQPDIVLLNQPTQGVDVGARSEIWKLLRDGRRGRVTLCASLDHDELITLCDSVIVFRQGEVAAVLEGAEMTKAAVAHHSVRGDRR